MDPPWASSLEQGPLPLCLIPSNPWAFPRTHWAKEAFAKGRGPVPFTATLFGAADDPTGGDRGQARQTAGGSLRRVGRVGEAFGGIGEVVDLHLPMKEMTWPVWRGGFGEAD